MNVLADRFSALDDPRESGKVIYPLTDIVVIAVCAAIAGAESYEDIVLYGKSKTSWLSEFLDLDKGISTKGSRQRHSVPRYVPPSFRSDRRGSLRGVLYFLGQIAGGGS